MERFFENLKREAEQNPTLALGVGAAVIGSIAKLLSASSNSRNSRAWAREVARREMKDRK